MRPARTAARRTSPASTSSGHGSSPTRIPARSRRSAGSRSPRRPASAVPTPAASTRSTPSPPRSPAAVLTLVFVAIFIGTDIVNRAQGGGAFLTLKQISTTFLFAAVLGLMAAGQTLVMLTGGVDLSVATTATAGAFAVSRFGTEGSAKAILIALVIGLAIGLVNGIGVALFR